MSARKQDNLKLLFTEHDIDRMNRNLAQKINSDFAGKVSDKAELLVIVTLKGALFFAADLMRYLTVPCRVDFVRVASYGAGTKTSGEIKITKDIETPVKDLHVLLLDEIVDSGRTVRFLTDRLRSQGPASLKVCTLLSKPSRREVTVAVDYIGREIDDLFVVGYGLDYGERYRNLKDIYCIQS